MKQFELLDQSDAGWPIREAETATSNVAGRCIGDNSTNNNNSGYCLHTGADGLLDVGMLLRLTDMPDIRRFKGVGDGEKGLVDAKAICAVATHTAKWEKVGRKGERKRNRKRRWGFGSRSQANATASKARTRTGHP